MQSQPAILMGTGSQGDLEHLGVQRAVTGVCSVDLEVLGDPDGDHPAEEPLL